MGKPDLEKWLFDRWPKPTTPGVHLTDGPIRRDVAREFFPLIELVMVDLPAWWGDCLPDDMHDEEDCLKCKGRRILRDLGIEVVG